MAFTVEQVKSLLQRDLVDELEKVKANIIAKRNIRNFVFGLFGLLRHITEV